MLDALTAGTLEGVSLHGTGFSTFDPYGTVNQFNSRQIPTPQNGMQGQNNSRYRNPEMHKWLDAAQKATMTAALKTAYSHIEEILAEDLPCVHLQTCAYPDVIKKGLKSYSHKAVGNVYNSWNAPWYWRTEWALQSWPPHCRQREFVCFAGTRYHVPWAAVSQPRVPRRERSAIWEPGPEL